MKTNNKAPRYERVLPTKMKEVIHLEFFRKFTWRERLKILIGYNVRNSLEIQTQHCAGKITPKMLTEVVENVEPKLASGTM